MSFPSFCVLFAIVFTIASAIEYSCTYKSPAGDFYDLSPLSKCDLSGYNVPSPKDGEFNINICNNVRGCGGGSSNCQMNQFDCGHASQTSFSAYQGSEKGVVLTYTGGAGCPNNANRKTILNLVCDSTADTPQFTFVQEQPECTYSFLVKTKEACPKPVAPQKQTCVLNVFLVPHTHDDVGWLRTIEGYYNSEVRNILDTSVAALAANPERKFIYVEQRFFTLWWYDTKTTDQQRNLVRTFVKEGRWEFIIGAWVMPDEACTTYGAVIDQMTLGHQFLLNTFDVRPTKGWQIDPFGASSVIPVLEKLAGFDAHLIDRVTDKQNYANEQRLEFLWQGSPSLGQKGQIFTEMMGGDLYCDWYGAFNFDSDPVNPGNVAQWGQKFINMAESRQGWYKTPNLLAEWGCDFGFQNAGNDFHSMDQVVAWLQSNANKTNINVKYAVPSEYYDSVWKSAQAEGFNFPVVQQTDYLPLLYGGKWWTGYFTSRTQLKGYVRRGEAISHTAEPLYSLGRASLKVDYNKAYDQINVLRVANGDAQHHDGVTGTSVPEVVEMYKDDLIDGIQNALQASSSILNLAIQKQGSALPNLKASTDSITNIANGQSVALLLFNSLGWTRKDVVTIPVNRIDLLVTDAAGKSVQAQVSPTLSPNVTSKYELFFVAECGPLGFTTYFVSASTFMKPFPSTYIAPVTELTAPEDFILENSILKVTVSAVNGLVSSVSNKKSGVSLNVHQNIEQYVSQSSGAYAFKPTGPSTPVSSSAPKTFSSQGPVVSQIHQTFSNYAKQTIRLFNASGNSDVEGYIDLDFDIGPLPSHIEIVATFSTPANTQRTITTDDNGFEFLTRKYNSNLGIEANYYPLIYAAYINDPTTQLTVFSERSHGVASASNGELEVMIHRNPDMGDGFGPGLTDTTEVYPSLRAVVDSPAGSRYQLHRQPYLYNFPLTAFTDAAANWASKYVTQMNFLNAELPPSVHLLSLNALNSSSKGVILRLTHLFAVDEDPVYSKPATIDIAKLFTVKIVSVQETTISANKDLAPPSMSPITLNPKEIRTFLVEFA